MQPDFTYKAQYVSNYDGDTVRLDIDLGFFVWSKNQAFRLLNIDCPEMRGDTLAVAKLSRDYVQMALSSAAEIIIQSHKDSKDKYGRWLAEIYYRAPNATEFVNLNTELVAKGFAVSAKY